MPLSMSVEEARIRINLSNVVRGHKQCDQDNDKSKLKLTASVQKNKTKQKTKKCPNTQSLKT